MLSEGVGDALARAMADLDEDGVMAGLKALRASGTPPQPLLQALQDGMEVVGQRYEAKEYYLSELLMSAELFKSAAALLTADLGRAGPGSLGTVVMGTICGDVHDIGKNIVVTLLACNGFKVIDLGVDVPAAGFIAAIREHIPLAVGFSCLLTTAFANMKSCIAEIEAAGLREGVKILVGGGSCDQSTADHVGADAYCRSAQACVDYLKSCLSAD